MRRFESINVIPFIDIMLVLLAIVLTTATFIAQGLIDIELPEADSAGPAMPEQSVELAIDQHQKLYYDGEPIELDAMNSRLSQLKPSTGIVLRVDARVPFSRFVDVVDLLKTYRLEKLSILTQDAG
jgi:biopolymer transport protein ExbD